MLVWVPTNTESELFKEYNQTVDADKKLKIPREYREKYKNSRTIISPEYIVRIVRDADVDNPTEEIEIAVDGACDCCTRDRECVREKTGLFDKIERSVTWNGIKENIKTIHWIAIPSTAIILFIWAIVQLIGGNSKGILYFVLTGIPVIAGIIFLFIEYKTNAITKFFKALTKLIICIPLIVVLLLIIFLVAQSVGIITFDITLPKGIDTASWASLLFNIGGIFFHALDD